MSLVPALLGAAFGLSLLLIVAGLVGVEPTPARAHRASRRLTGPSGRVTAAVATGVALFLLTGWVVGGLLAAVAATTLPRLLLGSRRRGDTLARIEGVAAWTEMLRADLAGAAGIEEAIEASAGSPPDAIASEVTALAAGIRHQPLEAALVDFAGEVDDPSADLVVTAVAIAGRHSGQDLDAALNDFAGAAHDEAAMLDKVDTSRTRARTAVRIVSAITVVVSGGLVLLAGDYMSSFDALDGQLVLALVGAVFAASIAALARMSQVTLWPRIPLSIPDAAEGRTP